MFISGWSLIDSKLKSLYLSLSLFIEQIINIIEVRALPKLPVPILRRHRLPYWRIHEFLIVVALVGGLGWYFEEFVHQSLWNCLLYHTGWALCPWKLRDYWVPGKSMWIHFHAWHFPTKFHKGFLIGFGVLFTSSPLWFWEHCFKFIPVYSFNCFNCFNLFLFLFRCISWLTWRKDLRNFLINNVFLYEILIEFNNYACHVICANASRLRHGIRAIDFEHHLYHSGETRKLARFYCAIQYFLNLCIWTFNLSCNLEVLYWKEISFWLFRWIVFCWTLRLGFIRH